MAYTDQKMGGGKIGAIVIVALIHVALGYAFITGLATNFVKKTAEKLNTFDVEEPPPPPPPDEPPPPPPPDVPMTPPPVVSPPPIVRAPTPPVQIATVPTPPKVFIPTPVVAPPQPPAPPAAPVVSKAASAKGDERQWITNDDYPNSSLNAGEEGRVTIAWTINTSGRAENCHTTSSSGSSALDNAACRAITRRARYTPATDTAGNPISTTKTRTVVWKIPTDR